MARPRNRANSEGSVYQRSRDGRWITSVSLPDGSRKSWTFGTQKEALQKLKVHHKQVQEGIIPITEPRVRLDRFLADWLEGTVKQSVRPKIYDSYAQLVRLYIAPTIGRVALEELSAVHVRDLQNKQLASGLSPRTTQYTRAVLRRALNQAVKWSLVPRNVVPLVDPPKSTRHEREMLTIAQVHMLLHYAQGDRMAAVLVTAIALGLRKGELLALTWQDVDFAKGTVTVHSSLQLIEGKPRIMETKTKQSNRTITLPGIVSDALCTQRLRQEEARRLAGARWKQTEYIFTTSVGTPFGPTNMSRELDRVLQKAGLPHIRFHDLRHLAASLLLDSNMRLKDVSTLLGHASTSITQNVYEHLLDKSGRKVADEMDRILRR